ncbi:MAG: WD40 repeat domain-containing protein [Isosphaeraceae bacterium]
MPRNEQVGELRRCLWGGGGGVRVWDAATGQATLTLKGHDGGVRGVALSPDGRRITSGSYVHTVKVWYARDK